MASDDSCNSVNSQKTYVAKVTSFCVTLVVMTLIYVVYESHYNALYVIPLDLTIKNLFASKIGSKRFTSIRGDGIGSQLKSILYSIAFAHKSEWIYHYSPITENAKHANLHSTQGQTSIIDKWLNMGHNELYIDSCNLCQIGIPDAVYNLTSNELFDNDIIHILKEKYFQNKNKFSKFYHINTFNVAVHVRRGDVNDGSNHPNLSPNSHFIKAMDDIFNIYQGLNIKNNKTGIKFHIFSDSKSPLSMDEYSRNGTYNVTFYINSDWKESFHAFVIGDALIMSKSTYSWTAAFFSSSNYIYYTPFRGGQPLNQYWYLNWEEDNNTMRNTFKWSNYEWNWWNDNNCSIDYNDYNNNYNDNNRKIYHKWSCSAF